MNVAFPFHNGIYIAVAIWSRLQRGWMIVWYNSTGSVVYYPTASMTWNGISHLQMGDTFSPEVLIKHSDITVPSHDALCQCELPFCSLFKTVYFGPTSVPDRTVLHWKSSGIYVKSSFPSTSHFQSDRGPNNSTESRAVTKIVHSKSGNVRFDAHKHI